MAFRQAARSLSSSVAAGQRQYKVVDHVYDGEFPHSDDG